MGGCRHCGPPVRQISLDCFGRGFQPMAEPFAELLDLEPEDVHTRKVL